METSMQPVPTRMALATTALMLGSLGTVSAVGLDAARDPLGAVPGHAEAAPPLHLSPVQPSRTTPIAAPPLSDPPAPARAHELAAAGKPGRHDSVVSGLGLRGVGLRGVDRTVGRVGKTVDHALRSTPVSQISEQLRRDVVRGIRRQLHVPGHARAVRGQEVRDVLASRISKQVRQQARRAVSDWYGASRFSANQFGAGWSGAVRQSVSSEHGYVGRHRLQY
jgi:hypothetical protein